MRRLGASTVAALAALVLAFTALAGSPAQAAANPTLSMSFVDTEGQPIRGVQVYAFTRSGGGGAYVATSGSDGSFTTKNLKAGTWTLEIFDSADQFVVEYHDVTVAAGMAPVGPIELEFGATITGKVTAKNGQALRYTTAYAEPAGALAAWKWRADAVTRSDGTYRITGVPAGAHVVHAQFRSDGDVASPTAIEVAAATQARSGPYYTVDTISGVKVLPRISLRGKARMDSSVEFDVTVTGTGGVLRPGGSVQIYDNGKRVTGTYALEVKGSQNHRGAITVRHLKKGSHRFKVKYLGSSLALSGWSGTIAHTVR